MKLKLLSKPFKLEEYFDSKLKDIVQLSGQLKGLSSNGKTCPIFDLNEI